MGRGQRKSKLPFTFLLDVPKSGKVKRLNVFSASLLQSEVTLEDNLLYCKSYLRCLLVLLCLFFGAKAMEMEADRRKGLTDLWG